MEPSRLMRSAGHSTATRPRRLPLMMRSLTAICRLVVLAATFAPALAWAEPDASPPPVSEADKLEFFEKKIRPVLVQECYQCHSAAAAAEKKLKGGLLLDSRDAARQGGDSGPAVVPGKPDESLLINALEHKDFEMPPKGKLPDSVIADFRKWVESGAFDPREPGPAATTGRQIDLAAGRDFWSLRRLQPVAPPDAPDSEWVRTPIDRFIRARQAPLGLRPNGPAAARTIVRRAWFDLTGLPPTPDEMETWVARLTSSTTPLNAVAYSDLVDHLLASPYYGERWARHWMDVARFAESHGYEQDYDRPTAYHYRDFLIRAFNADLPYDEFVRWQLAGDELAPDEPLAWMATGFLAAGAFPTQLTEAEFESARYDELDDMVATTGVAFLGLSVGCARCHDHKFDPIRSDDYYRLASSFTTTIRGEKELNLEPPGMPAKPTKVLVASEGLPHLPHHADDRGFPHFYPETHFLRRGDVKQKGDVVSQGFLPVLSIEGEDESRWRTNPPSPSTTSHRRAALARWMTDVDHGAGHLAARVIVNRLWQHHFGRGLVATPNDFGASGERPSHPELLDWLAADLVQNGWRLKRLHKLIMTSAVYLESGEFDEARAKLDRENVYLWRRTPRRLEAEAIRDSMLAVSGLLDAAMFGPGTLDQGTHRRSVYFFIKRSQLIPMMMLFDWPEHLVSIGQRASTTIAPQALMFMNSPQGRQYAEGLAARLTGASDASAAAYALAFGRPPSAPERELAVKFLSEQAAAHAAAGHADSARLALVDFCQALMSMNEFVYVE
jgi:hypothetical protein